MNDKQILRTSWKRLFKFDWLFGLGLILLLGIPRFILVLNANITGNYSWIALIFLCMWITPIIFLTKSGRRNIGITKPDNYKWLLGSFVVGASICLVFYGVAILLFAETNSNWFVYISRSYGASGTNLIGSQRHIYFLIYAITGITFSPIGEELFYRGLVHGSFVDRFGEQKASTVDSLAFALTHLAHFGIVYLSGVWQFLFLPATLWLICMFIVSRLFFVCKQKSGSILGAIICHAGFNLMMMYLIFYYIL